MPLYPTPDICAGVSQGTRKEATERLPAKATVICLTERAYETEQSESSRREADPDGEALDMKAIRRVPGTGDFTELSGRKQASGGAG